MISSCSILGAVAEERIPNLSSCLANFCVLCLSSGVSERRGEEKTKDIDVRRGVEGLVYIHIPKKKKKKKLEYVNILNMQIFFFFCSCQDFVHIAYFAKSIYVLGSYQTPS